MFVYVYIKAKNKLLVDINDEVPFGEIQSNSLNKETPVLVAMKVLKCLYGLRFKESQFIDLGLSKNGYNIGLNLDYFPESYTEYDPKFIDVNPEKYSDNLLLKQFLEIK